MKEFKTPDLYFSAYLITAGCILKRTERLDRKVFFVFEDQNFLADLKMQYFNGEAKVKAQPYAANIKNLKSLTHSVLNS